MRQVVAGYPQYTEDLVRSDDPQQPFQRAVKATGALIVDDALSLTLEYAPTDRLYLANGITKSWSIYLRERGTTESIERPAVGIPLYNDYIVSREDVWLSPEDDGLRPDPLDVLVPAVDPADPLPDRDLRVTSYLRHAPLQSRRQPGGGHLDPTASIRLAAGPDVRDYVLAAFDPAASRA